MKTHGTFVIALLGLLATILFAGCSDSFNDMVLGNDSSDDSNIQIDNENGGQAYITTDDGRRYRDEDGGFTREEPLPVVEPTATPAPDEAGLGGLLGVLLVMSLASGCVNTGKDGAAFVFRPNLSPNLSLYSSRSDVGSNAAMDDGQTDDRARIDTDGGGSATANTDVGQGDGDQTATTEQPPPASP